MTVDRNRVLPEGNQNAMFGRAGRRDGFFPCHTEDIAGEGDRGCRTVRASLTWMRMVPPGEPPRKRWRWLNEADLGRVEGPVLG